MRKRELLLSLAAALILTTGASAANWQALPVTRVAITWACSILAAPHGWMALRHPWVPP